MSLLHKGQSTVKIFPEVESLDEDGNTILRASQTGYEAKASVQAKAVPEEFLDVIGDVSEVTYRMRLADPEAPLLGASSQVEWHGARYSIVGDGRRFEASNRTQHVDYLLRRR